MGGGGPTAQSTPLRQTLAALPSMLASHPASWGALRGELWEEIEVPCLFAPVHARHEVEVIADSLTIGDPASAKKKAL
jgi:hypothetical protein